MDIAVTGGFGSGKSTASRILAAAMSADYLNTDHLCRQQMLPGKPGFEDFYRAFGNSSFFVDGTLDRNLLRRQVFTDKELKKGLEKILHPLVRQEVALYSQKCRVAGKNLVVEVPLLFEVGWQEDFTVSVVVYVQEELCVRRVVTRDGFALGDIQQVLAAQLPLSEKMKRAHFIINNSGTFASTVQQISWLGRTLLGRENEGKCVEDSLKSLTAYS